MKSNNGGINFEKNISGNFGYSNWDPAVGLRER
jgi:hypothetical protein